MREGTGYAECDGAGVDEVDSVCLGVSPRKTLSDWCVCVMVRIGARMHACVHGDLMLGRGDCSTWLALLRRCGVVAPKGHVTQPQLHHQPGEEVQDKGVDVVQGVEQSSAGVEGE